MSAGTVWCGDYSSSYCVRRMRADCSFCRVSGPEVDCNNSLSDAEDMRRADCAAAEIGWEVFVRGTWKQHLCPECLRLIRGQL